jgi:hypothetical protein
MDTAVDCGERFREVDFADQAMGRIQLANVSGAPGRGDHDALEHARADADTRAGILTSAPAAPDRAVPAADLPRHLGERTGGKLFDTLGAWGPIAP